MIAPMPMPMPIGEAGKTTQQTSASPNGIGMEKDKSFTPLF